MKKVTQLSPKLQREARTGSEGSLYAQGPKLLLSFRFRSLASSSRSRPTAASNASTGRLSGSTPALYFIPYIIGRGSPILSVDDPSRSSPVTQYG